MSDISTKLLKLKLIDGIYLDIDDDMVLMDFEIMKSCNLKSFIFPDCIKSIDLVSRRIYSNSIEVLVFPSNLIHCSMIDLSVLSNLRSVKFGNVGNLSAELFKDCSELQNVSATSINHIGKKCFSDCMHLEDFDFSAVRGIVENYAFRLCINLKQLSGMDRCKDATFGIGCFSNCTQLSNIHLSNNCSFGMYCFSNCGIESIILDENITISSYCFVDNTELKRVIIKDFSILVGKISIFGDCNRNAVLDIYNVPHDCKQDTLNHYLGSPSGALYFRNVNIYHDNYKGDE